MAKGSILRIAEGTTLSPELTASLNKLIPGFQIEYYAKKPDYKASFQRRVDSLYEAFLFILDAYPLDPHYTHYTKQTLSAFAAACKAKCDLQLNSKTGVSAHNEVLKKFTGELVQAIAVSWPWSDKKLEDATACLNEAEQYCLMRKGRPDLATVYSMQFGDSKEFVVLLDESIPPYTEQWLNELKNIKRYGFPKTLPWLRELPEYQKAYFFNLDANITNATDAVAELTLFRKKWDEIKSRPNIEAELADIAKHGGTYPWFESLKPQLKKMMFVLANKPVDISRNLDSLVKLLELHQSKNDCNVFVGNVAKIPEWYWALSKVQQHFLEQVLKADQPIENLVSFLSSRHRTLPVPANFAAHTLFRATENGVITQLFDKRWRSSHIASRDVLKESESIQRRHSESNWAKVVEAAKPDQLILFQTLISPIFLTEYIPEMVTDALPDLPPDNGLYKVAQATVNQSSKASVTSQHNHPFNLAKYVYYTAHDDANSLSLIRNARLRITQLSSERQRCLVGLLNDYEEVLNSPVGTATFWDYEGRELFLSSLEQLIIMTADGFSYGSCVSGKDRKAVEIIHTNAMILYREKYGSWPKFGDPKEKIDRARFVAIVADQYCTRHQQTHGGHNAPGSEGIKTPDKYFPADIVEKIKEQINISYDDVLASNNEVRYIIRHVSGVIASENQIKCRLVAQQLGEENCTTLYDALCPLINESSLFQSKNNRYELGSIYAKDRPRGISQIHSVMLDRNAGLTNVERMGAIFAIVMERPSAGNTRSNTTNQVYDSIRQIIHAKHVGAMIDTTASKWKELFKTTAGNDLTASM